MSSPFCNITIRSQRIFISTSRVSRSSSRAAAPATSLSSSSKSIADFFAPDSQKQQDQKQTKKTRQEQQQKQQEELQQRCAPAPVQRSAKRISRDPPPEEAASPSVPGGHPNPKPGLVTPKKVARSSSTSSSAAAAAADGGDSSPDLSFLHGMARGTLSKCASHMRCRCRPRSNVAPGPCTQSHRRLPCNLCFQAGGGAQMGSSSFAVSINTRTNISSIISSIASSQSLIRHCGSCDQVSFRL